MGAAIKLDENLLNEAMELTGISEKELVMNTVLSEFIKLHKLPAEDSEIWIGNELQWGKPVGNEIW